MVRFAFSQRGTSYFNGNVLRFRLKNLMMERNVSQSQLAKVAGISESTFAAAVRNMEKDVTLEVAVKKLTGEPCQYLPETQSHTASTITLPSKHSGEQPTYQSHVNHRIYRIRRNGTASGGTSHKIVIRKTRKCTAKAEQYRANPFLYFILHIRHLLPSILPS